MLQLLLQSYAPMIHFIVPWKVKHYWNIVEYFLHPKHILLTMSITCNFHVFKTLQNSRKATNGRVRACVPVNRRQPMYSLRLENIVEYFLYPRHIRLKTDRPSSTLTNRRVSFRILPSLFVSGDLFLLETFVRTSALNSVASLLAITLHNICPPTWLRK